MKYIKKFESLNSHDDLTVENLMYIIQEDVDDGIIFEYISSDENLDIEAYENIYEVIDDKTSEITFETSFGYHVNIFVTTNFIISDESFDDSTLNVSELTELTRFIKSLDDKCDRVGLMCVLSSIEFKSEKLQFCIIIQTKTS